MVFSLAVLVGCSDNGEEYTAPPAEYNDVPDAYDNGTADDNDAADSADVAAAGTLVGEWNWMGTLYYTFNDDGTGLMAGMPILWTANNGILRVCSTPDICESMDACIASMDWDYTISGNEFTISSRTVDGMVYTYTRR